MNDGQPLHRTPAPYGRACAEYISYLDRWQPMTELTPFRAGVQGRSADACLEETVSLVRGLTIGMMSSYRTVLTHTDAID